jgi:hypothetical protein
MASAAWRQEEDLVTPASKSMVFVGVAALIGLGVNSTPAQAETIRGCKNPGGQVRLIGATESCKSQETLVTWSDDADSGVTGGADRGPTPPNGPAFLSSTPTMLTTDNVATGFPMYMVWATVAVEFNSGNTTAGTPPSGNTANCFISYTVNGVPAAAPIDGRSVAFPIATLAGAPNDRVVRLNIGLNGMIGNDPAAPITPDDEIDVTLNCAAMGSAPPNPVKAQSYVLSGIGVNKGFVHP